MSDDEEGIAYGHIRNKKTMKHTFLTFLLCLYAVGVSAASFDASKTYSIKNTASGLYLSLQSSYKEDAAVTATPLTSEATYFSLTTNDGGKTYAISTDEGYMSFSTTDKLAGWNTAFSKNASYVWEINTTETEGQYTITSAKGFLKYDGTHNYAYTDGKTGQNITWLIEERPNPGVAGIDYPVANLRGDMNGDGLLTMADATAIIDILLGRQAPLFGMADFGGTDPGTDPEPSVTPEPTPTAGFPQPDGSPEWYMTDKAQNLGRLLLKIDPAQALSRSMYDELTDDQFNTIKATADAICKDCKTDADKISALNDWVYVNIQYGEADNRPWAVFQNRIGICQGKADLFKVMLLTQRIPAVTVNGWYNSAGHAWTYAYDGANWYVCDPTNTTGKILMTNYSKYGHLKPDMADIPIFDDADCTYNYYEGYLNVCAVKRAAADFVVPFGKEGFRVCSFNPSSDLPATVRNIYIGSNIKTLGENIVGLRYHSTNDEACYVDPYSPYFSSYGGVVYKRNEYSGLDEVFYIPTRLTTLRLKPMEKVEKNTILDLKSIEVIIFAEGTKTLEPWAIESCPALRTVYVPKDCNVMENALYLCPNAKIVYGLPE